MRRVALTLLGLAASLAPAAADGQAALDVLILGGRVLDGAGNQPVRADVGVAGDRIAFVGRAGVAGVQAADTVDAAGLLVTPGFWDMHSHAEPETEHGRLGLPMLYQGITTVVLGVDGDGDPEIADYLEGLRQQGTAVNVLRYVGHGDVRRAVMGMDDRAPTPAELAAMEALVRKGLEEGAAGFSTGLFYTPGFYADTEEVIALNRVNAAYGGVYDTHDRDLGALYPSYGYLASIHEAIRIAEEAGTPLIFSHFNPQGRPNYGRAPEGAAAIDSARARGVDVMAAQHVYTATKSNLIAYAVPRWAAAGGHEAMLRRFEEPDVVRRLDRETAEMLAVRGGASKLRFTTDRPLRPELGGRTLEEVARDMGLPVPAAVRAILRDGNAGVMNLELYDAWNTRWLAQREWMMTCTDGGTPVFGVGTVHPRSYGAFTKKLREFVYDEGVITLPFAVRGMTSLAATFLGVQDRGLLREGLYADIAVFDEARVRDRATYEDPHRYAEGTVHVLVNGRFALRDGAPTGTLAGRPIPRPGAAPSARRAVGR